MRGSSESQIRQGGALLVLGAAQFVVAMAVTQFAYPGYSPVANYVSDLGADGSPWAIVFNASLWALGILGVAGTYLGRGIFPDRGSAKAGQAVLYVTWAAAFLVGFFPEQTGSIHTNLSAVAFVGAGIALALLGASFLREGALRRLGALTLSLGLLTLVAVVVFAWEPTGNSIQGVWERLVIAPILLWAVSAGLLMRTSTRLRQVLRRSPLPWRPSEASPPGALGSEPRRGH